MTERRAVWRREGAWQRESPGRNNPFSKDPGPHDLEVTAFEAIGHDRVVGGGAGAVEELKAAAVAVRAFDNEALEFLFTDKTGAGTGNKKTARLHQLNGETIEVLVLFATLIAFFIPRMDEFGGIEDNGVPLRAVAYHGTGIGEGVGMHPVDAAALVEIGVCFGLLDGLFVEIHRGDFGSPAGNFGGEGKAACVAAKVEHTLTVD